MRARRTCVTLCALVLAATAACASGEAPAAEPTRPASATAERSPEAQADETESPEAHADETDHPTEAAVDPVEPAQDDDAGSAAEETMTITIADFAFEVPGTVAPGAQVTVINEDASYHTVTADNGAFDVGARQGEPATFTAPTEPGEYTFHCGPHPEMVATLVVG